MRLHYPLNSQGAEDAGKLPWTDGVPSTGVQGSYPGHAIVTDVEAEILAVIDASGQTRNGSDLTQLVQGFARGIWLGQFSGTANALAAAIPNGVVFASLLRGTRFTGYVTATNTAGVTVALTCLGGGSPTVTAPLLRKNGTALQSGDLPIAQDFDFRWDGAAFRMTGSVASDGGSASGVTLVATQTLWVRLDGSDANDGSANDAAHAFATIAAAVAASFKYQTTGGAVLIRLGQTNTLANPYAAPNAVLNLSGRSIRILGDTAAQDSYIISGAGQSDGTGLIFVRGGILQVSGARFVNTGTTSTTLAAADFSLVIADHCSFAMAGTNPQAHTGGYNGNIILNDGINYASPAGSWLTISHGSANFGTGTITFTGNPNWSSAGVIAVYSALASPTSLGMPTISGPATGKRFAIDPVSWIHTAGSGVNKFPGDVAGTGTSNYS